MIIISIYLIILWLRISSAFDISTQNGIVQGTTTPVAAFYVSARIPFQRRHTVLQLSASSNKNTDPIPFQSNKKKLLVLGGTGFLGQAICKRAVLDGYFVTSLSRRGYTTKGDDTATPSAQGSVSLAATSNIDYRSGDAREKSVISSILNEGGYCAIVHCVGLLFDKESRLARFNRFASGSGSIPDSTSTYDSISRLTAFNTIDCTIEYAKQNQLAKPVPFVFISAAEAGWQDGVRGGKFVENNLTPNWLRRYLAAKRQVEAKLMSSSSLLLRPIIFRPSLIYSVDKPFSWLPVGAFFVGNRVGLPFVDRPVTVQALSLSIMRAIARDNVRGVQRYTDIDALNQ